jgi:hypothetical protein
MKIIANSLQRFEVAEESQRRICATEGLVSNRTKSADAASQLLPAHRALVANRRQSLRPMAGAESLSSGCSAGNLANG